MVRPDTVTFFDGEAPICVYQRGSKSLDGGWPRADYLHPLYDLDGRMLTEDFPDDHPHHRGIFWAWHQVLVDGAPTGDAWLCQNFLWDVRRLAVEVDPARARLRATVLWRAMIPPSGEEQESTGTAASIGPAIARERTEIRILPIEHGEGFDYRCIDFQIRLQSLVPSLSLGGSDDVKGYGGFSARIRLDGTVQFSGRLGAVDPQTTQVDAGPWMHFSWPHGGLVILEHPANPGFPQPWILRRQRSMQNAVFPGRTPYRIPPDEPLILRYRLVVHRGCMPAKDIETIYEAYHAPQKTGSH